MKNLFVITLIIGLVSCSEESPEPIKVSLELPDEPFEYLMESNAATLGRVLFYDKQLSINNSISCASCHKQSVAFSDNKRFSFGFENQITARNSMPIQNLLGGFSRTFEKENTDDVVEQSNFIDSRICCGGSSNLFWDGRAISSPESLLIPILNHVEMGIPSTKYLVNKVSSIRYYPDLFEKAFQEKSIDADKNRVGFACIY